MKKTLSLLLIACFFVASNAFKPDPETEGLTWVDFNQGYQIAKKKNKIMLVDVYTDWCGWCKRMDRDTYGKSEIIDRIRKDYVAIKFNPEIRNVTYTYEGKSYTGDQLVGVISNNQLSGYPTTIFIYPKDKKPGKVVGGYQNADAFGKTLDATTAEFIPQKGKK